MAARSLRVVWAAGILAAVVCRAQVSGPLVTTDRWPRTSDLVTWTGDVMRIEGLEKASETAQGRAFFEWLRLFCRMAVGGMIQAYEGDYNKERYVLDAQKNLFVYGWGYCDTFSRIAEAAWKEYKKDPRAAERVITQHEDGGYHTMYRLRLDGHYGAFDARYGYFLIDHDAPDARILDWAEVGNDQNILKNKGYKNRSRPFFEIFGVEWERAFFIKPVYFESQGLWEKAGAPKESVFGNSQYQMGTRLHNMDFRMPKGTTIERFWDNSARAFYVPASHKTFREWPFLRSGRFYRVTETSIGGNFAKYDPNYQKAKPYLATVPTDEEYPKDVAGGRTIGQAWGRVRYEPDLKAGIADALAPDATLVRAASAPYLRPAKAEAGGSAVLDFYSPYVLVDGTLETSMAGAGTVLEMRTLKPKNGRETEPDVWSAWQALDAGKVGLGRARFDGQHASIHGVYRFQLRVTVPPGKEPGGLSALKLELLFENNIMGIPQIFAGMNTVRFQVRDAGKLRGPVRVTYRYQTAGGEKESTRVLKAADFRGNEAAYNLDAPGLVRCNSVAVEYR